MNVRNAGVFALMFAASLLLLLPGCQGPLRPEADAPVTGTVSLSVERLDMSRAIMPGIGIGNFDSFRVVFSHATLDAPDARDGTLSAVSADIELPAGAGWTVDVFALIGSDIVARGGTTFEVVADDSRQIAVTLYPLGDEGNGTFAWTLTFPGNVTAGSVAVIGVGTPTSLPAGAGGTWAYDITLPAGNYVVHINLENPDGMVMIEMELLIFGNLESSFTFAFVPGDFAQMPEAALASAITIAEGIRYGVYTSADGTDVLVGSFWATAGAITAFENAIVAAREALLATGATPATLNAARLALLAAQATFQGAIGPGTYVPAVGPVLVGTPGTVDRAGVDIVLGAGGMAALITGGHFGAAGDATVDTGAGYVFAYDIPNNSSGLRVLPAALAGLQPGDVLRATGRTTGTVDSSRLELAYIGASGGAGLGSDAVTPSSPYSIPGTAFTFNRILTAEDIAGGLRIAPNTWGLGEGEVWADRFTGFAFSIDDLIIFRPPPPEGVWSRVFHMADYIGHANVTAGTAVPGTGAATSAFSRNIGFAGVSWVAGNPVAGVGLSVRVGPRTANWNDARFDLDGLLSVMGIAVQAGDEITIVGRAITVTTGAGWRRVEGRGVGVNFDSPIAGTFAGTHNFDFTATLTGSSGHVSVAGNGGDPQPAGINYVYIDNVMINGYRVGGTPPPQPGPGPGNGNGETDNEAVRQANLSAHLAGQTPGAAATLPPGLTVVGGAGGATLTVGSRGGLNYLIVSDRGSDWHGIDITTTPLQTGDIITVRGRAPSGATMVLGGADDPWTTWVSTTASVFTLTGTWGVGNFHPAGGSGWNPSGAGAGTTLRLQSRCTSTFQVYDIIIGRTPPALSPIPPLTAFTAADWQRVIDSFLVRARGSTLAATAAGLLISGRGTGEHDNNNGLLVDVRRLRTLYGGTPEIVITGTIAGATSGQMQMQGTGVNAPIGAGGAFTVTIPGTAAINPPDWANTNYPFLGTGTGIHGNITVNSITIGSVHIQDLTHLAGPPGTVARRFDGSDGTRFANSGTAGRVNGFDYEAWTDHRGAEGFVMYIYNDGSFRGTWNQTYNTLFRVGRRFPGSVATPTTFPTVSSVGNISLRHNTTAFTSTNGATYLTVYGWAFDGNNQIEFYIIDSSRNWTPVYSDGSARSGYTHHGSFQSGGVTWDVVTGWRIGQPALTGQSVNFLQIFSVRRGSQLSAGGTGARTSTINVSDHFNRWITIPAQSHGGTTINFTGSSRLYEVMWCVEGFGGTARSSGTGIVTELCIHYGTNRVCTNPSTCPRC